MAASERSFCFFNCSLIFCWCFASSPTAQVLSWDQTEREKDRPGFYNITTSIWYCSPLVWRAIFASTFRGSLVTNLANQYLHVKRERDRLAGSRATLFLLIDLMQERIEAERVGRFHYWFDIRPKFCYVSPFLTWIVIRWFTPFW